MQNDAVSSADGGTDRDSSANVSGSADHLLTTVAQGHPGPWRLADNDPTIVVTEALDDDGNCSVIADVLTSVGDAGPDDIDHARLIAAAPELLEALIELADLMDHVTDGNYTPDSFTTQPARFALAKATGAA